MKKIGLFLMAMGLATAALLVKPMEAHAGLCTGPICIFGPRCCSDAICKSFCENLNPGSQGHCSGSATESGCCSCTDE